VPPRCLAKTAVAPAAVALPPRRVLRPFSAPVRSIRLGHSLAIARQSGGTDAPDSRSVSPLRTAPGNGLVTRSSSSFAGLRFPSQVLRPPALLPPGERSP